uniref:Uncharacterized protein LOC113799218 isoform X1 n=1 Tax=Dermatophagoides pteronyssinus TaxID=6956 RepID=A0A6P6YL26_DERPT|nr:uncharacterized protein LOC113799218 isoform X1 [Dermatophagoides pteronyssinus]
MKNQLFDSPGLAASNRNSASQQLLLSKNSSNNNSPNNRLSADGDKFKYQTSHHHQAEIDDQSNPINIDFDRIEPGAILVYNKTKLIVVPETKFSNQFPNQTLNIAKNSSSNDQMLLPNYITIPDHHDDHDDKPRQLITRTDKESSSSSVNNKSQANIYSTISSINIGDNVNVNDDIVDDINIMVNHLPNSDMILTDFQRIGTNRNDTDVYRKSKIPEYRQSSRSNSTATTTSNRSSHARHLGSHHRGVNKSSIPTTTTATTTGTTTTNSTRTVKNLQIPSRPVPVYKTPEPFSNAIKCSEQLCKLPDCFCGGTEIPGELSVKDVPQLVLISFDDAVNDINWHIYEELLNSGRSNPNGCPIKATFYVSHEWTDYSQVQTLYSRGHEIASHSITHSFGESYTSQQWHNEIVGQREILHLYGGVNKADIRGMRAPFLQGGGNKQFEMLHEENFTYDSSMPVFENSPPFWPYTLDYTINHECMIAPCPTKSFPGIQIIDFLNHFKQKKTFHFLDFFLILGLWEIGLVMWQDLRGGRCSMGDACSNPSDENGVYDLIMKNFKRHYNSNRAPFGLYYHSAWFNSEHHRQGFLRVIDDLLTYYKDVYFVTKWELIQWIRNPTALKELYRVNLFSCARDPNRPPPCLHPNICNVGANSGVRFLKTCQPCPKRYPWLDDNGQ